MGKAATARRGELEASESSTGKQGFGRRWYGVAGVAIAAAMLWAIAYTVLPPHADLTRFDPHTMARLETAMWRHDYDNSYLAPAHDLYSVLERAIAAPAAK